MTSRTDEHGDTVTRTDTVATDTVAASRMAVEPNTVLMAIMRHSSRDRFWLTLVLSVSVVVWSPMFEEWSGYSAPQFPGVELLSPVLGSVIFFYGGWPFLAGAVPEIRDRRPGMMLLIGMAIAVAYVASMATSIGVFDDELWWEPALLIVVML